MNFFSLKPDLPPQPLHFSVLYQDLVAEGLRRGLESIIHALFFLLRSGLKHFGRVLGRNRLARLHLVGRNEAERLMVRRPAIFLASGQLVYDLLRGELILWELLLLRLFNNLCLLGQRQELELLGGS